MITPFLDFLVKRTQAMPTRRATLRFLAGLFGGGLAGLLGVVRAAPGERKRKRQRRRERRRKHDGRALYPELRTLRPEFPLREDGTVDVERAFDEIDDVLLGLQHVLRFTNTVWNAGTGRLELEGSTDPAGGENQPLFQNLYDAPVGGNLVDRRQVNGRIVYHDSHAHYHFADFASYHLLRRNDGGDYVQVGHGEKTSFCIIDSTRIPEQGGPARRYTHCEQRRQGLTPGWGDTYDWRLADQWVVLEEWPLPDGEYGLRAAADPKGLLLEGGGDRERNNAATTYFTYADGEIGNVRGSP